VRAEPRKEDWPLVHVGQKWIERFGLKSVVIKDYDPTTGYVSFRENHDRAFGMWLPEDEFYAEYDYIEREDA
jgi:hypothetical protein